MSDENKKGLFGFEIDSELFEKSTEVVFSDDGLQSDIKLFLASLELDASYSSYSSGQIKKSGRSLRKKQGDLKKAIRVVQSYRADHREALDCVFDFIQVFCAQLGITVTCAKRLKRLDTIINKLQRPSLDGITPNQMCITKMGDIGGCRVICESIADLKRLQSAITAFFEVKADNLYLHRYRDYIEEPKVNDCGYRGVHLIIVYTDNHSKKFRIELQLRTKKQHLWATAVEMVG